jgi:curli biogenesis system outer membrane secretion channel CsgG
MERARRASRVVIVGLCLAVLGGCAELMQPTARVTSAAGPDIQQATLERYDGPKARIAVSRFVVKAAKAHGTIGDGLADMLATALFQTNRYIVLERQALSDVLAEQDLGASGRVRPETAAAIGRIEGAELLVVGTVTEFDPGTAGAGASIGATAGSTVGSAAGGWGAAVGQILGTLAGSVQTSHVAIDLRIVDTRTSRVVAATSVQGKATDIAGLGAISGPSLGVGLSGYARTPMEKAVRIAINEAVSFVVSKTPAQYYRYAEVVQTTQSSPQAPTSPPPTSPLPAPPPPASALSSQPVATVPPSSTPPPASETTPTLYVKTQFANMRAEPSNTAKVLAVLRKGMKLTVVDEKSEWYRVKLEDGKEGWVAASVLSLQPE